MHSVVHRFQWCAVVNCWLLYWIPEHNCVGNGYLLSKSTPTVYLYCCVESTWNSMHSVVHGFDVAILLSIIGCCLLQLEDHLWLYDPTHTLLLCTRIDTFSNWKIGTRNWKIGIWIGICTIGTSHWHVICFLVMFLIDLLCFWWFLLIFVLLCELKWWGNL